MSQSQLLTTSLSFLIEPRMPSSRRLRASASADEVLISTSRSLSLSTGERLRGIGSAPARYTAWGEAFNLRSSGCVRLSFSQPPAVFGLQGLAEPEGSLDRGSALFGEDVGKPWAGTWNVCVTGMEGRSALFERGGEDWRGGIDELDERAG